jgi:translation elongation factor EF-Ts
MADVPTSYVRRVRELAECGLMDARDALAARSLCIQCAVEYVQRKNLAVVMPDRSRYPLWTAHVARGRHVEG